MPLTLDEIKVHPGTKKAIDLPPPTSKGYVQVGKGRGGPFKISYEIYGNGPVHTVWIMGLNAPKIVWHRQCRYFGIDRGGTYSVLIFDNRGAGESDKPLIRYSTSEMAKDLLEVLEHVGWNLHQRNHIVGISMGGMIALEFAFLAPEIIASMVLQSTAASLKSSLPWYENLYNRTKMIIPKTHAARLANSQNMSFSKEWLGAPDDLGVFPTNADRHIAEDIYRTQHLGPPVYTAFLLQALAASGHHVSAQRLNDLQSKIGRISERHGMAPVLVLTGTQDKMIEWKHSVEIVESLGGSEGGKANLKTWEGAGHVLHWEREKEYNEVLVDYWAKAEKRFQKD